MGNCYIIGDPHLGHKNIAKFRSFVKDSEDNTRMFLDQYAARKINKKDIVYFMGDVAFDAEHLALIKSLPGRKILIKGNHDDTTSLQQQTEVFEEIHGIIKYKGMWFSHCPIHPDEIRKCRLNVHGHVHNKSIHIEYRDWKTLFLKKKLRLDPRYVNTCVDVVYPATGSWFMTLADLFVLRDAHK